MSRVDHFAPDQLILTFRPTSTHVTQVTCVKANVVFFDRKPGNWTARTKTLRIYSAVAYSAIIQLIDGIHKLLRLIPPEAVL